MITLNIMSLIPRLFVEGGALGMSIVTLLFIAMLFAAWKAPNWVKELGLAAMVMGILWTLLGLYQASDAIIMAGDISPTVMAGGLKVTCISHLYGVGIYLVSLVIRCIQQQPKA